MANTEVVYKMKKEMANSLLKTRKKDEHKLTKNEFLCKIVNEEFNLNGKCTKVITY